MHLQLGYCFWYQLFFVSGMWCWFGSNTLDSELVLWFCLKYTSFRVGFVLAPNISKCWVLFLISALLSLALHFILHISSIMVVSSKVLLIKNIREEKYHVSIWQLFLVKFAAKMCYVWQSLVVAISRRKRSENASRYVCHDTYIRFPTRASACADWPMQVLRMILHSGCICGCQSCVLRSVLSCVSIAMQAGRYIHYVVKYVCLWVSHNWCYVDFYVLFC